MLRYHVSMMSLNLATPAQNSLQTSEASSHPILRALSLASLVIGATAVGVFIGRELRHRYKFNRRTPYDFYSKAGDPVTMTEYGMGV